MQAKKNLATSHKASANKPPTHLANPKQATKSAKSALPASPKSAKSTLPKSKKSAKSATNSANTTNKSQNKSKSSIFPHTPNASHTSNASNGANNAHNPSNPKIDSAKEAIPSEIINAFELTDYNRTIALCTAFLSENPSAPQVWFICGMSLYYLSNIPRAIESLQIALTLAPNDEKIAFNLAEILRQNGNAISAIKILSAFVPCQNGDVYYNLARALTTQAETLNAQNLISAKNSPKMTNLQNLTTSQNRKSAQNLATKSDNPMQDSSESISLETLTNPQYFINPYEPQEAQNPQAVLLLAQAKQAYKAAIELNPLDKDAIYNLANLHAKDNEYAEAIALYEVCGTLNAKLNLAFLYNQIDEGKKACEIYASLESGFAKECGFLPLNMEENEFDKNALDSYFKSNILPNMPKKRAINATNSSSIQQFDEATLEKIALYKSHIERESSAPQRHISQFYFNYANTARYAGLNMLSFYLYGCAYCLDANALCAINYAHLALSLQNFSLGFKLYEERLALEKADVFNAEFFALPNYLHSLSGTPQELQATLRGKKVLIFGEQGLGDMIMFGRFIDTLERVCECKAYLYVRDELKGLFGMRYEVVERDFRAFDYCVSAMSLAYILGVKSLEEFSQNEKYLANLAKDFASKDFDKAHFDNLASKDCAKDSKKSQNQQDKTLKIGFFFASTSGSSNAKDKSIPLDSILRALFNVRDLYQSKGVQVQLHCLQPESLLQKQAQKNIQNIAQNDKKPSAKNSKKSDKNLATNAQVRFYDLHSFLDTAKVMSGLSIVASIDSAPAHLAIALGIPCVVVAHKRYDWRWEEIGKNISLQSGTQKNMEQKNNLQEYDFQKGVLQKSDLKKRDLQENILQTRFSGLCGGEVLAQGKNGDWAQVGKALESYLVDFANK